MSKNVLKTTRDWKKRFSAVSEIPKFPTLRDHLFEKLVLGLVSCILVQSQMYEYLKRQEYPPERGYDLMMGGLRIEHGAPKRGGRRV